MPTLNGNQLFYIVFTCYCFDIASDGRFSRLMRLTCDILSAITLGVIPAVTLVMVQSSSIQTVV